jgi:hypothetical protein
MPWRFKSLRVRRDEQTNRFNFCAYRFRCGWTSRLRPKPASTPISTGPIPAGRLSSRTVSPGTAARTVSPAGTAARTVSPAAAAARTVSPAAAARRPSAGRTRTAGRASTRSACSAGTRRRDTYRPTGRNQEGRRYLRDGAHSRREPQSDARSLPARQLNYVPQQHTAASFHSSDAAVFFGRSPSTSNHHRATGVRALCTSALGPPARLPQ